MCVCARAHVCVCERVCVRVCVFVCLSADIYTYTNTYLHIYIYIYTYIYIHMYMYIYMYTHIYIYVFIYIYHMCTYIHIYHFSRRDSNLCGLSFLSSVSLLRPRLHCNADDGDGALVCCTVQSTNAVARFIPEHVQKIVKKV